MTAASGGLARREAFVRSIGGQKSKRPLNQFSWRRPGDAVSFSRPWGVFVVFGENRVAVLAMVVVWILRLSARPREVQTS